LSAAITFTPNNKRGTIGVVAYIVVALLIFLFALDLIVGTFQHLERERVETFLRATANPFAGLVIGLLVTAMIQSSSATTALVVALVASGSLKFGNAVPIIMGANIGTTITSCIVSLAFISKKKEFRRAVSAGTYHCFFNILTAAILFPLEYYYQFLSGVSMRIGHYFFEPTAAPTAQFTAWSPFDFLTRWLIEIFPNVVVLTIVSLVLLLGSVLLFRRYISRLLRADSPETFGRFFFNHRLKSFAWGAIITAAIRSSTITTSMVVPVVAKKIATLRQAAPFILGANIGTTLTAFLAALGNASSEGAISIAIAHFLFNAIGVIVFFPLPVLFAVPISLAKTMASVTYRYRVAGFLFIVITFFIIPFSLIFFNQ
jgi:solute carrier family 34 (sodium-dependent phosphate cotransporter)